MTALALAVALAALPEGSARYRFELSGEHVGLVELSVVCLAETCTATWTSERRAPADAGGRRSSRRVEVDVDREGRWRGGRLRVAEDGGALRVAGVEGAVPATLAEVVLARAVPVPPRKGWQSSLPPGPETCLDVFDEWTGAAGRACARHIEEALHATVLGTAEVVASSPDGFPARVDVPEQGARFVRDGAATAPREPPRLHGTVVPGPSDPERAGSFCGASRDPEPFSEAQVAFLPEPRAAGASCREKSADWLLRARQAGLRGRTAVGVAWDGERFVWHAWPEVRLSRGWVAVDPSFGQRPARGPRFTIAAWEAGDEAGRRRAGERILACWPYERVRER
jgi:hypothetical protein